MARPQKIKTLQRGKTWYIQFQKNGERIRQSLKTQDKQLAQDIAQDINRLFIDEQSKVHPTAYEIYFGERPEIPQSNKEKIIQQLRSFNEQDSEIYIIGKLSEQLEKLQKENSLLKEENQKLKEELESLKLDKDTRRIQKYKNLPTFKEILPLYIKNIAHLDKKGSDHKLLIQELVNYYKFENSKINELETSHISRFLQEKYFKGKDPAQTWNRKRRTFHRFWKWLSVNYEIENIVITLETKKQQPKQMMNWHSLKEVQEEIEKQGFIYWKAVIATMAYAGLSAHELRGLKKSDYDGEYLYIHSSEERRTKSDNRTRAVQVHKEHLKPILEKHIDKNQSPDFLFPALTPSGGQWRKETFSRNLNKKIKTENMNALSLRRTFGSLLIRAGKTETEIAAAMGNTATMVRKHYAKLLGNEIDIDF